ncbi:MAG: hypothetical protein JXR82_02620 [Marinifilaceae bacterium]|nr:hypothetical protein [Marinifilaceae bacterium]
MSIKEKVKRKLWASSGGYCAKPDCHTDLFPFFEDKIITNIEELAHVVGQKKDGPRGNTSLPLIDRDEFENIILLCPTCHTTIDKNPKLYSESTILQWKNNHEESIRSLFSAMKFESREGIRQFIFPIMVENRSIFMNYGPYSKSAMEDPMATELIWERLAIQKILPNNRKLENTIELNQNLLEDNEFDLFAEFKLHREGFEYNKISGDVNSRVLRFPNGFDKLFK